MPVTIAGILSGFFYKPILRPVVRFISGLLAIPLFRFLLRRVFRVQAADAELERDLENWFRGAVIMLAATANLEDFLFGWLPWHSSGVVTEWPTLLLRLLLAVGVIESMPDQDLFIILHRGPPKVRLTRWAGWQQLWRQRLDVLRGLCVLHLRRSSPVFVIMAVVVGGEPGTSYTVGWWCYGLAITQYLIIAVITDRDRVAGLLDAFERNTSALREELLTKTTTPPAACAESPADPSAALTAVPGPPD